jgi:hypothetical protein
MAFSGGSAYSMARDIAEGYTSVNERTFKNFVRADLEQLTFELDRHLRELRGEIPAQDDTPALQQRNRRIQRLNTAIVVLRSYRQKSKN